MESSTADFASKLSCHFDLDQPSIPTILECEQSETNKMAQKSSFNLERCARRNILKLVPYRCARE
jgi:hypothetical protein